MTKDQILAKLHAEIAELRRAAAAQPDPVRRADRERQADAREAVIEAEAIAVALAVGESA